MILKKTFILNTLCYFLLCSFSHKPNELIWSGIQGTQPQYFDNEREGMGYNESYTKEIRHRIKEEGIAVKLMYMTSDRLEYELKKSIRPICFYPFIWKPSQYKFSSNPDRIISIPLNFTGEEIQKLIIRSGELERFKKHLDEKNNINLESLVLDKSLKGLFLSSRQMPEVLKKAVNKGEIETVILNQNTQLLEMLQKKRFDYTLEEFIGPRDYDVIPQGHQAFETIQFQSHKITAYNDPNMTYHSVVCSKHKLSIKAMPIINEEIQGIRGPAHISRNMKYQKNYDERVNLTYANDLIIFRYLVDLKNGKMDDFFDLQMKLIPQLQKFPLQKTMPKLHPITKHVIKSQWQAINLRPKARWIIQESTLDSYRFKHYFPLTEGLLSRNNRESLLLKDFWSETWNDLVNEKDKVKAESFNDLPISNDSHLEELHLFAAGLSKNDSYAVIKILQSSPLLKTLSIIDAKADFMNEILPYLPNKIENINFALSRLHHPNIANIFQALTKLKKINFHESHINEDQLAKIIATLPSDILELHLGWSSVAWSDTLINAFSRKKFTKLKVLDLENNLLKDASLVKILNTVPSTIVMLNLNLNLGTSLSLVEFFKVPRPHLKSLGLALFRFSLLPQLHLSLPDSLEELDLSLTYLNTTRMQALSFPKKLKKLIARQNLLDDQGASKLVSVLDDFATELDLSNNQITGAIFKELQEKREITTLNLSNNPISKNMNIDRSKRWFRLEKLYLGQTSLVNNHIYSILDIWGNDLKELNIGGNLITTKVLSYLKNTDKIESIYLENVYECDSSDFKFLPKKLISLNLSANRLSDSAMISLAKNFPKGLRVLNLEESNYSGIGLHALAQVIPYNLIHFDFSSTNRTSGTLSIIASVLPTFMQRLNLRNLEINDTDANALASHMPANLKWMNFWEVKKTKGNEKIILQSLPPTVREIANVFDIGFSSESMSILLNNNYELNRWLSWNENSDYIQLAKNLNSNLFSSLFSLCVKDINLSEKSIELLMKQFKNINTIEFSNSIITKRFFNALKKIKVSSLLLSNSKFNQNDFNELKREDLQSLRILHLKSSTLNGSDIREFFKLLPSDMVYINISSTLLKFEVVDSVIQVIPKGLRKLIIRGNDIGQKGVEKFRDYKARIEKETGLHFDLEE